MALPTRKEVEDLMSSGACAITLTTLEEME